MKKTIEVILKKGTKKIIVNKKRFATFTPFIPKLVKLLKDSKNIKSAWVHGSRALNQEYYHNEQSDLDITLVINQKRNIQSIKRELLKIKGVSLDPHFPDYLGGKPVEYWYFADNKDLELGIRIVTENEIEKKIKNLYYDISNYEQNESFAQHVLIESLPLYDPYGILSNNKNQVREIPDFFRKKLVCHYLNILDKRTKGDRNIYKSVHEEMFDLVHIIIEIARCQYALNNKHCLVPLKQYPIDAKELIPDIDAEINHLAEISIKKYANYQKIYKHSQLKKKLIKNIVKKLRNYYKKEFKK